MVNPSVTVEVVPPPLPLVDDFKTLEILVAELSTSRVVKSGSMLELTFCPSEDSTSIVYSFTIFAV